MDDLPREILKELLPAEKEAAFSAAQSQRLLKDAPLPTDHWTPAILLERAAYLRKLARYSKGSASETLKEYPQHCAMLSVRVRSGDAELHENFADLFYVLDGRATLVTGGAVAGAQTIGPGEVRGVSVEGGTRQELRAGDVAHVPAGVPHQMLVPGDKTVTCFVMKIQENL